MEVDRMTDEDRRPQNAPNYRRDRTLFQWPEVPKWEMRFYWAVHLCAAVYSLYSLVELTLLYRDTPNW